MSLEKESLKIEMLKLDMGVTEKKQEVDERDPPPPPLKKFITYLFGF